MVIFNRNEYNSKREYASKLLSLINKYHPTGEIYPTLIGDMVKYKVVSNAQDDFFSILPNFTFSNDYFALSKRQVDVKNKIEKLFFNRLRAGATDIILTTEYNEITFDQLLEVATTLKYSVKMFPIHTENIIYIGIGSKKLGRYVMELSLNKARDGIYPKFDIDDGFIVPFPSELVPSNSSVSTSSRYSVLNYFFNKWKNDDYQGPILDLKPIHSLAEVL